MENWRRCKQKPLFSFLTHFSGRRRINKETNERTVETDECIAVRLLEEYPDLISNVSIVFDNMIVDFNELFPSLATELEMLSSVCSKETSRKHVGKLVLENNMIESPYNKPGGAIIPGGFVAPPVDSDGATVGAEVDGGGTVVAGAARALEAGLLNTKLIPPVLNVT